MKLIKQTLVSALLVLSFLAAGSASARTCYDPYYGYFNCGVRYVQTCYDPYYGYYNCGGNYYPGNYGYYNRGYYDDGGAVMTGAAIGFLFGAAINNGWGGGGHWHGGGGYWNGGGGHWHGGGGHWHH